MSDRDYQLAAIVLYLLVMLGIGYYAYRRTQNLDGYMLANRGLRPSVAALSANASDMSGWLLLGLPGAIYAAGLVEAWIAIGLIIGAWLNWRFVAPRLRAYTEISDNAITIPSFFSKRLKGDSRPLRIAAALVILVFFTFYVSSGMVAAGKFFESSFGWPYLTGLAVVAVVTLGYTLFGGFLGATLTDVAQGLLMLAALIAVPVVAVTQMGGVGAVVDEARAVNPDAFNLFSGLSNEGAFLGIVAIVSTAAWGLGYFGQPHIIVRFMALRTVKEATVARRISLTWMLLTTGGAVATALIGIAYFADDPALPLDDPETVFLVLSQILFHPFVAGLVLAAVLAAIMSTMSSQLVVCSSALVEDLYNLARRRSSEKTELLLGRGAVLAVAVVAAVLALDDDSAILDLVAFAWAGFGAAFGPIVLLSLYWRRLTPAGALAGLVTGAVVVLVWGNVSALSDAMYEIVPGFLLNLLVAVLVSRATARSDAAVDAEFDAMEAEVARS
ncbi:sodium/proline symporter PutP [Cellulosimicrobium sp. Marseille-Q4280]|uniref:sodium/proline symporter PutP n=1 Tax=Cellulosimicrobium sp. Marseille-Q4280 TaxID=2937992 RepID=UPI00203C0502|nr:sodium/proline symporter PutP [Cellulosimicrobium sp. Marseille-Q4280]